MNDVVARRRLGPITQSEIVGYQGASGDLNPVHHDPAAAARAGWDIVLVPGLYPAAVLSDLATGHFGAENVRSFRTRFAEPVWLGDTLECTATLCGERTDAGRAVLDIALRCVRTRDRRIVTTGTATFVRDTAAQADTRTGRDECS